MMIETLPTSSSPSSPRDFPQRGVLESGTGSGGVTVRDAALGPIAEKLARGERLSMEDGRVLFATRDIHSVLAMADGVRRQLHGDVAYYNINRHLNYSNVCALSCKFCDFYAKVGEQKAYTRDVEYIRGEAIKAVESGATEMHIVGGLHPQLPFSYYTDMLRSIRAVAPGLHLKAFTAVEIVHLAKIAKVYKGASGTDDSAITARREAIRYVLKELQDAGLGSLPGGGAEVFDDRVHDQAFKGKIRSDVWLTVHDVAHELGLNSNATMLYGHIESRDDRLVHLDMLRRAQDRSLTRLGYVPAADGAVTLTRPGTELPLQVASKRPKDAAPAGYFQTLIPLPFFPDGSELEKLAGPSGLENYRTLAVARLMLDNFPHIKAFWIMQTLPLAQVMLQSGADDLDGTVVWYDITHVGGASTHQEVNVPVLHKAIREAGFKPVERDTLYRRVQRDGKDWWIAGTRGGPVAI
jgi:aminodeoxyfutalosine synthase